MLCMAIASTHGAAPLKPARVHCADLHILLVIEVFWLGCSPLTSRMWTFEGTTVRGFSAKELEASHHSS